ncbi:MAG: protein kinase [Planctomycetes bacterium]|nr:protein kinase [Planctomycetota bacterium]
MSPPPDASSGRGRSWHCPACGFEVASRIPRSGNAIECPACGALALPSPDAGSRARVPETSPRPVPETPPRPALPEPQRAGETLPWGDYEIEAEIARGGMGVVYRAKQRSLGRVVALKILQEGGSARPEQLARFRREAALVGKLRHPGIVSVHDAGIRDGLHYFSMEFVEGESLDASIARGPLDPGRAATILAEVARAADHAHRHGVVHRDLKPANILLDASGRARVTDFGLAKIVAPGDEVGPSALTASGTALGTPFYMSPEQARGEAKRVDRRSDVFSLGVILYETLTGRRPFEAETRLDLYRKILEEDPVSPRKLRPEIPPALERVALKALQKRPADRYGTAAELAGDLDRARRGEPVLARPASAVWRVLRVHRVRAAALGLSALAAAGLVTALVVGAGRRNAPSASERGSELAAEPPVVEEAAWEEVFGDDFERPELGPDWKAHLGRWEIRGGHLVGSGISECALSLARSIAGDIVLSYRARMPPRRVFSDLSAYLFGGTERPWATGYYLGFGAFHNERSYIHRAGVQVQDSFSIKIEPGRWHEIRIVREGYLLSQTIDGRPALSYEDYFPLGDEAHTELGLYTFDSEAEFDDVVVRRRAVPRHVRPLAAADDLYRLGQFAEAQALYEEIASRGPEPATAEEARYKRALTLWSRELRTEALAAMEEFARTAEDPRLAHRAILHQAQIRIEGRDSRASLDAIRSFLVRFPESPVAPLFRATIVTYAESCQRRGKCGRALPYYREALHQFEGETARLAWIERQIGLCLAEDGKAARAIEAFQALQVTYPGERRECAWAQYHVGETLARQGKSDEAIVAMESAVERYGKDEPVPAIWAATVAGDLQRKAGRTEEAIQAYWRVVRDFEGVDPRKELHAFAGIRELARDLGRIDEVLDACQRIVARLPLERGTCAAALLFAADALRKAGRKDEALVWYRRVVDEYPGETEAAGKAREKLGE